MGEDERGAEEVITTRSQVVYTAACFTGGPLHNSASSHR